MALPQRTLKQDLRWLLWPITLFMIVLLGSIANYFLAFGFQEDRQRTEFNVLAELDLVSGQVREIERAEEIIINNIDRYNRMVEDTVMDEEDRVALLEDVRKIREEHQLFPITVELFEQERLELSYGPEVETPDEQLSLRLSRIQVLLPLLHEADLQRFLNDFTGGGRLVLTNQCEINQTASVNDIGLQPLQHQMASCEFLWFTMRREPYNRFSSL